MDCISLAIQIDRSIQKQLPQVSQDRKRNGGGVGGGGGGGGDPDKVNLFSTHNKLAEKQVTCTEEVRRAVLGWLRGFHADDIFTLQVSHHPLRRVCHCAVRVRMCSGK